MYSFRNARIGSGQFDTVAPNAGIPGFTPKGKGGKALTTMSNQSSLCMASRNTFSEGRRRRGFCARKVFARCVGRGAFRLLLLLVASSGWGWGAAKEGSKVATPLSYALFWSTSGLLCTVGMFMCPYPPALSLSTPAFGFFDIRSRMDGAQIKSAE